MAYLPKKMRNWWTNPSNKQRPQPHVIIELPFLARVHSRERISDLYVNGNSLREIERQLNIPKTTARGVLIASGIEMRTSLNHQSKNVPQPLGMRSGTIPFGFTYLNGKLVIEPSEYKVVLEIVRRHQKDESFRSIARHLNNKKVTTRLGKKWTHEIVKRVIERQQKTKRRKS